MQRPNMALAEHFSPCAACSKRSALLGPNTSEYVPEESPHCFLSRVKVDEHLGSDARDSTPKPPERFISQGKHKRVSGCALPPCLLSSFPGLSLKPVTSVLHSLSCG